MKNIIKQPINEKDDGYELSNYRGVTALLSIFSNNFAKAFYQRLMMFLEINGCFSSHQFGFLKGRSTKYAIMLYNIWASVYAGEETAYFSVEVVCIYGNENRVIIT